MKSLRNTLNFADYMAEAEKRGAENDPLYAWTKATIEDSFILTVHASAAASSGFRFSRHQRTAGEGCWHALLRERRLMRF
jgi:hypothetical protein